MNVAERREKWQSLAAAPFTESGELRVIESSVVVSDGPVLFALDAQDQRHLLVPLPAGQKAVPDRRSRGVHLVPRALEDQTTTRSFLDVACRRRELNAVFDQLAGEMLDELLSAGSPGNACRAVLERWRSLLDREPSTSLVLTQLVGLFGEVYQLRLIVTGESSGLRSWQGPHGNRHDFALGGTALEVKTSLRSRGRTAVVNGVEQLNVLPGQQLFLAMILVEEDDEGGESVPNVVDDIIERGADRVELLTKLLAAGYDGRDRDLYSDHRFRVADRVVYRVDDAFPRIVPASFTNGRMPAGTASLVYEIDLGGERPEPISEEEEMSVLERLRSTR